LDKSYTFPLRHILRTVYINHTDLGKKH